jgi:hypothetical protein
LTNVKDLAIGGEHIVAWGFNGSYRQATVPAGLMNINAIATGWEYTVALVKNREQEAEQPEPTGLAGVAPTTNGGHDGRVIGVTTLM